MGALPLCDLGVQAHCVTYEYCLCGQGKDKAKPAICCQGPVNARVITDVLATRMSYGGAGKCSFLYTMRFLFHASLLFLVPLCTFFIW